MSKEDFMKIECISRNPLRERIVLCFDIKDNEIINFERFLIGLSYFNSPGERELKMKTAFRLHDFDDNGSISIDDLICYIRAITFATLDEDEVKEIANNVFLEFSPESVEKGISYLEFQQVVSLMDFQSKLSLPF